MKKLDFTAIDFETANQARNSICQIGICRVENGVAVYAESFLVQPPQNDYSHWNIGIHGIGPERTQDNPLFPEIWDGLKHYFEGQLVVAHNVDFDLDCLFKTLAYYQLDLPTVRCECTYRMTGLTLVDLAESLGVVLMPHHDALNDALMCAESYVRLKKGEKPDVLKITPKEPVSLFAGHERLSGQVLKPDLENADSSSPFYNKKVVFTGILSGIERKDAAEIIKKMGADIDTSISRKTDFVVVGSGAGPSKLKKIGEYNQSGSRIKMITEVEFLEMVASQL